MALTTADDFPALGFDPAPGDVEAVEDAVSTIRSVMQTLDDVATALDGAPVSVWCGALATAFDELFGLELKPAVETAGVALDESRRALVGWAGDLKDYQRRARALEVEAAHAQQRAAAAASELDRIPVAAGPAEVSSIERRAVARRISRAEEELVQGRSDAKALLEEYIEAGDSVARLLEGAEDAAPVDLRRLTGLAGVAAIIVGGMSGPARDQYLRDNPEAGALLLELELRAAGLLDGPIESDAYRTWLENAARRGVSAETILDIVRRHSIGPDDFAVLDGLEEVTDPDGKSFFVLPDDIGADDARKAVLMTYILNAGTDYGTASPDNDFPETPYSADEIQRIIDRQKDNDWSYDDDVGFIHANGGRLVTTPNGMLMGLGGNWLQDVYSQKGGTTWGDIFMLNIDDVDDPVEELRETVRQGRARYQDDDGSTYSGDLDLDRLLHHEERHSEQWADEGHAGFLASYVWEQIKGGNETEEDAGLSDGGYE